MRIPAEAILKIDQHEFKSSGNARLFRAKYQKPNDTQVIDVVIKFPLFTIPSSRQREPMRRRQEVFKKAKDWSVR